MKFPPFNQDAALLRIEGIRKSFRSGWFGSRSSILAVDNVSFEVRYGEVVGLIGGSGSGKTTIARLIMGLERPDTGRVFFDGRELTGMPWGERRRVSCHLHMVFQDPYDAFLNSMRVRDIVAEPLISTAPCVQGPAAESGPGGVRRGRFNPNPGVCPAAPYRVVGRPAPTSSSGQSAGSSSPVNRRRRTHLHA